MNKLIIVDRDGVINEDSADYIKSPAEWHPIPQSLEAIAALSQAGFSVVIASNQSGLARGYYTEETLTAIHLKMTQAIRELGGRLAGAYYCPHGPDEGCLCRKPAPGLLHQIAEEFAADLTGVPFVGDSWRDLEAAIAVSAQPVLVLTGNGLKTQAKHADELKTIPVYANLWAFSQSLLVTT